MAYGTQININGSNMVSMIEPAVFIDMILTASGSRTALLNKSNFC